MIIYLLNLILALVLLFILIKIFGNSFPTDEQVKGKKSKRKDEISKIIRLGNIDDKKKFFEKIYKDKIAQMTYFSGEWEEYTSKFIDFSEKTIDYYEGKFKVFMYETILNWKENDIDDFVEGYFDYWIESKVDKLRVFFSVLFVANCIYLSFSIYPLIQRIILSDALYASVYTIIATFVPSMILGIIILIPIYVFFIRKRLLGLEYENRVLKNSGETNIKSRSYKIMYIFLFIIAIGCSLMYAIIISFNVQIKDDGVYYSEWNSFEYNYYSWDKITHIYHSSGEDELGVSIKSYYYLEINDVSIIDLSSKNFNEINNKEKEMVQFIEFKTGLELEEKILK